MWKTLHAWSIAIYGIIFVWNMVQCAIHIEHNIGMLLVHSTITKQLTPISSLYSGEDHVWIVDNSARVCDDICRDISGSQVTSLCRTLSPWHRYKSHHPCCAARRHALLWSWAVFLYPHSNFLFISLLSSLFFFFFF